MKQATSRVPGVRLADGTGLPMVGFGTFQIPPHVTQACVEQAIAAGCRAADTAQCYGNEAQVGLAIESGGAARDKALVTAKAWADGYRSTRDGIACSAESLAPRCIFVGTVMACGVAGGDGHFAPGNIAERFRDFAADRSQVEVKHE